MNKDVIYIDVDDDVTAIIGKIKKAKEKIVAVVPPKRAGTLQSAVNLRLLDRMAKADKKQLVLITNNQALIALAANSAIPVAKNLQSKPEIAEITAIAVDDADDIIDGADLPVGDHANTIKVKDGTREAVGATAVRSDVIESLDIENPNNEDVSEVLSTAPAVKKAARGQKSKVNIPNFDKFRKRLFLGIGGGILLVALLVWMFVFAPAATVIVTAATTPTPVSATFKLGGTAATDFKSGVVKSVAQTEKKDETIQFDATGTKDVGAQASGTVVFKNCESDQTITVAAGTAVSANGLNYITQTAASVPGASGFATCSNAGTSSPVQIIAQNSGANYNVDTNTTFAVAGRAGTSGAFYFKAVATTAISGGTSKIAKVVSSDDIDRATGQLIGQSTDAEKKSLSAKFTNGEKIIDSSFTVDRAPATSAPAVNTEAASGKATLTISTTYTISAIPSADLESYLNSSLASQLTDANNQKVYDTGIKQAGLSNYKNEGGVQTVAVTTTGQIGPKIDEATIKNQVKGKIYGEVQSALSSIDGIKNVDVKFSYFWVTKVPNNTNKIHIEFKLENS
ncbi:MAG: hypothetical protein JWO99_630 [Candidatus Saccharibacteria bacterium]|nr:hypothetical protein [Candidatus Saccharibacteria bacterium]